MFIRLLSFLPFLAIPCLAQPDSAHHLWLLPNSSSNLTLQANPKGQLRLASAEQQESNCWQLAPAKNKQFYIVSAAFQGRRGLSIRDGKIVLAANRGLPWKLQTVDHGTYILSSAQGQLGYDPGERQLRPVHSGLSWVLWSRHRQDRFPKSGNLVRWQPGEAWIVLKEGFAGHAQPAQTSAIVRRFARDTILRVDAGRGGSDEIFWNQVDDEGNTWLKVSDQQGKPLNCYVRANRQWLKTIASP